MDVENPAGASPAAPTSSSFPRIALWAVQLGAVGVVLAALPYKLFDLDRFFVPKELVLHASAATAALAVLVDRRRSGIRDIPLGRIDIALVVFLLLSAASAAFATNGWLATRALAISASGLALYWASRHLRAVGSGKSVVAGVAFAVVIGALTGLVQAYFGPITELFSINRAPGGTFGNRNFMAHLSAIGAPALVIGAIATRRRTRFAIGWLGAMIIAASLVLSRSRAAWVGLAAAAFSMLIVAIIARPRLRPPGKSAWRRAAIIVASAGAGAFAAAFVPNRLNWNSANPYLESMRDVVNYKEGSGKGRLVQYKNSLDMAVAHPVLGVGPGNWPVQYVKYASRRDPSLADDAGMTDNPWPSSDWVAFLSERGAPAMGALLVALIGIVFMALIDARRSRSTEYVEVEDGRGAFDLIAVGTVAAAGVVGAFDAALLLAAPTAIVWPILGAATPRAPTGRAIRGGMARALPWAVAVAGALVVARNALQIAAMSLANGSTRGSVLSRAAMLDPGSYKIQLRAAKAYAGSCKQGLVHASAANDLFPSAGEPKRLVRACGKDPR